MSRRGDPIPTGIQALVSLASVDEPFRNELARRRSAVAAAVGVWLTPTERAIVDTIPEKLLRELSERMVQPPQPRRSLLRQVARTAVAALSAGLISQAALGCGPDEPGDSAGEQVAPTGGAQAADAAPEEPVDRVRGPMVMHYGIKGPSVMPDPHTAREAARKVQPDQDPELPRTPLTGKGVGIAGVTTKGSLSEKVVRRIAKRHLAEVRACCEREGTAERAGSGRVLIKFIVSATGKVQIAAVAHTALHHARVEECIVGAVKRWVFPPPEGGGIAIATVAFDISLEGKPAASKAKR